MKIKKKAEASLIAWVLLVGLTVTLAGFVTNFAIKNARKFEPEKIAGPEMYCGDVKISLQNGNIKNRGSLTIVSVYCTPSKEDPIDFELKPGDNLRHPCSSGDEIIPGVESSKGVIVYCPMGGIKVE